MSIVRPFRGLRPRTEIAGEVAAPPYDVLSRAEAVEMARGNPRSFLRVNKAEIELPESVTAHDPEVYGRAARNLQRFEAEGTLIRDAKESLYIYRLTMDGRSQTGVAALTSVEEYDAGRIKKHEHTRPAKVADRADHILALGAQVGPVFSTFRDDGAIARLLGAALDIAPAASFVSRDGVEHEIRVVDEPGAVREIVQAFARLPALYIADGHHRSEAASEVRRRLVAAGRYDGRADYFLNVLFPSDELRILPYNRVVRDLAGQTPRDVLARATDRFDVHPAERAVEPDRTKCFGVYVDRRWYRLTARPGSYPADHPTRSIDASVLGEGFLAPILGIDDPRKDERIDFVGGIRGVRELERLVDSGSHAIAFSLHATSIAELLAVADAGEVMPPKSTWFEPKLRSGLVVHVLEPTG